MTIEFYTKNVYGKQNIYIKDQEQANLISRITGKKTIDNNDIDNFGKLGLNFIRVFEN